VLYRQPGLYVVTSDGLRGRGLSRLGVYRVSPGGFVHAREVASAAAALHFVLPGFDVLAERELRLVESDEGKLLASVKVGELAGGVPALHRPDLVFVVERRTLAVEVELSVKAPRRLQRICTAYARASSGRVSRRCCSTRAARAGTDSSGQAPTVTRWRRLEG
jgi:hypothetical protein